MLRQKCEYTQCVSMGLPKFFVRVFALIMWKKTVIINQIKKYLEVYMIIWNKDFSLKRGIKKHDFLFFFYSGEIPWAENTSTCCSLPTVQSNNWCEVPGPRYCSSKVRCGTQRPTLRGCEPELVECFLTGMEINKVFGYVQLCLKLENPQKECAVKDSNCECASEKNFSGLTTQGYLENCG